MDGFLKKTAQSLVINSVYGQVTVEDPLAIELITSPSFERLREINQYGVVNYIVPTEDYTRYDHSIGVYLLLIRAGASREEQIAGLLHDISHTVFSHVGDYVFQENTLNSCYQDDIHCWYLEESGLQKILNNHGLKVEDVDHKKPGFHALELPLPHLCADRIEYNLQGGLLRKLLSQNDFDEILRDLTYGDEHVWSFRTPESALKLGRCSLIMTESLWGAPWEVLAYRLAADALRRSFEIQLVSFNEFHFSTDDLIWKKLDSSKDPAIQECMRKLYQVHSLYTLCGHGEEDLLLKLKFRGIDPLVRTAGGLKSLTTIDSSYAKEFERVKRTMLKGWPIKFNQLTSK